MTKNFIWKKCISASCAALLLFNQTIEAAGALPSAGPSGYWPEIPNRLAVISETYRPEKAQGGPPVLLIQDAHAAYPVQRKIADLLEFLYQSVGKEMVLLTEAAPERLYPENLEISDDPELNLRASDRLMQWGELAGWENFIFSAHQRKEKIAAYGIESTELYHANWEAFRSVYTAKAGCAAVLEKLENRLENAARRFFDKPQVFFLEAWKDRQTGRRDLMTYAKELQENAGGLPGSESQFQYPALSRLSAVMALQQQSSADTQVFKEEKERLLDFMHEKKIRPELARALMSETLQQETDLRLELERFYTVVSAAGFRFGDYPELSRRWGVRFLTAEIRPESLENELKHFEETLLSRWMQTTEQKKIVSLYRRLVMFIKTLELGLSREDYGELLNKREHFSPHVWIRYFAELDEGMQTRDAAVLEEGFAAALRFYEAAVRREAAFAENIQAVMRKNPDALPVVVTGGFHTPALAGIFRSRQQPFVSLMPAAGLESYETGFDEAQQAYLNALLEGKKATMGLYSYLAPAEDAEAAGANLEYRQNRLQNALRYVTESAKSEVRMDANRRHRLITRMMNQQEPETIEAKPRTPAAERYPELKPRRAGWGSFLFFLSVTAAGFFAAALIFLPGFRQDTEQFFRELHNRIVRTQEKEDDLSELPAAQPLGDDVIEKMTSRAPFKIERTRMKRTFIPEALPVPERIRPALPERLVLPSVELPPLTLRPETLIPPVILEELQRNDFQPPKVERRNEALTAPRGAFSVVLGRDYLPFDIVSNVHHGEVQKDDESYGKTSINNLQYREAETGREFNLRDAAQKPVVLILTPSLPGPVSRRLNEMAARMEHLQFMYVFPANAGLEGSWKPEAALERLQSTVTSRLSENNAFNLPAAVWTPEIMKELGWVGGHNGFQDGKRVDILILIPGRGENRGKIFARTAIPEKDLARWLDEIEDYGSRGTPPAAVRSEVRSLTLQNAFENFEIEMTGLLPGRPELNSIAERIRAWYSQIPAQMTALDARSMESQHALVDLNSLLAQQGHYLLLAYDAKQATRLILYAFDESREAVRELEGENVRVHYIKEQISPGEHASSSVGGWCDYFGEDVVVNTPNLRFFVEQLIYPLLSSADFGSDVPILDFFIVNDLNRDFLTGENREVLQQMINRLVRSSFAGAAGIEDVLSKVEEAVLIHELDHERHRRLVRALDVPEIEKMDYFGVYVETLAELRSMVESSEPGVGLIWNIANMLGAEDPMRQRAYLAVLEGLAGVNWLIYREQLGGPAGLLDELNLVSSDRNLLVGAAAGAYWTERIQVGMHERINRQTFRNFLEQVPLEDQEFWRDLYLHPPRALTQEERPRVTSFLENLRAGLSSNQDFFPSSFNRILDFALAEFIQDMARPEEVVLGYSLMKSLYFFSALIRQDMAYLTMRERDPIEELFPSGFILRRFEAHSEAKSEVRRVQAYLNERRISWQALTAVAEDPARGFFAEQLSALAPATVRHLLLQARQTDTRKVSYPPDELKQMDVIIQKKLNDPLFSLDDGSPVHLIQPWRSDDVETAALFMRRLEWLDTQNNERAVPLVRMTFVTGGEPGELLFQALRASAGKGSGLTARQQARLGELLDQKNRSVRLPSAVRFEQSENFVQTANALSVNDQSLETASAVISRETGLRFPADVSTVEDDEIYETPEALAPFYLAREQILAKAAQHLRKQPADRLQADKIRELQAFLFLKGTGFYLGRDGQTIHWSLGRMLSDLHAELRTTQQVQSAA